MSHLSKNSISIFLHHFLKTSKCFILMQTPLRLDIWLQSYEGFDNANNNMKQRNLNTVFANITKTISWHPTHSSWSCHIFSAIFFSLCSFLGLQDFTMLFWEGKNRVELKGVFLVHIVFIVTYCFIGKTWHSLYNWMCAIKKFGDDDTQMTTFVVYVIKGLFMEDLLTEYWQDNWCDLTWPEVYFHSILCMWQLYSVQKK